MEKPAWRVRSSTYVVESEHLRLRSDEIELPDGTVIPNYYFRESRGFVMIFAITAEREVVLLHQYRYGIDATIVELPAGTIDAAEEPLDCAKRELAEETGYTADRWEPLLRAAAEPVRSNSVMHAFIAFGARKTGKQTLDLTETIEPFTVPLDDLPRLLRDGTFGAVACVAVAYAALERLARG